MHRIITIPTQAHTAPDNCYPYASSGGGITLHRIIATPILAHTALDNCYPYTSSHYTWIIAIPILVHTAHG